MRFPGALPGQAVAVADRALEEHVALVLGQLRADELVGVRARVVDEPVGRLRRAQPVEEESLHAERDQRRVGGAGLVVGGIVEAAVADPGGVRELAPLQPVGQVAAARHVAHVPGLPVRARGLGRVRQIAAVAGERLARQRDRPVGGQPVGIEQHPRRAVLALAHVQHALVLQTAVAREEPAPAGTLRRADLLVVQQLAVGVANGAALRHGVEVGAGQAAFGLHPRLRLRRVDVLQPAIRVGHGGAEEPVGPRVARRIGVAQRRTRDERGQRRQQHGKRENQTSHAVSFLHESREPCDGGSALRPNATGSPQRTH